MNNDLISRSALKKELIENEWINGIDSGGLENIIDEAPTVVVNCKDCDGYEAGYSAGLKDAERPQGEWLEDSGNIACSHCHTIWLYRKTDYCPNCGAKMVSSEKTQEAENGQQRRK